MNFQIFCVGKLKESFYREQVAELMKQINKGNHKLEIFEVPDVKIPDNLAEQRKEDFLEKECKKISDKITNRDYVIALCIEGKEISTSKHQQQVKKAELDGFKNIVYVIGGSLGLPESIKSRANLKLSFSKMTFPHQIMRVVLCEEIVNIISM